jgi:hypothetical protein
MTSPQSEYYPVRRFRLVVASLCFIIIILTAIGLLSRRTLSDNRPAWKSAPYGDTRDKGSVRAGH